jgi:enoyl-CoA hydratase
MTERATYQLEERVATITMDDGKVNAMSTAMLGELAAAFERARSDRAAVLLTGKAGVFSAGFDLKVFASGNAADVTTMLRAGAELTERILSFPFPVVTACTGHAYPMGAFLMLAADVRFGADGPYRIGMNEVAIRIVPPRFAIELARLRLTPAAFNRVIVTGEMLSPTDAAAAGFLDHVLPAAELLPAARAAVHALSQLDMASHGTTKLRVREQALKALREAIAKDFAPEDVP